MQEIRPVQALYPTRICFARKRNPIDPASVLRGDPGHFLHRQLPQFRQLFANVPDVGGLVAPAADGPLPIGDIIAVGGAIWTACDIYDLVDVLPKEIENSLKGTVDSLQAQTVEAVSNAAKQTRAAHEQAARSLAASAWADRDELQVAAR